MLDFQRGRRPRNYLSRREQWRLLLMVMLLGLVVVLAIEARDSQNYAWLLGGGLGQQEPAAVSRGGQVDTRLTPPLDRGDSADTFSSPAKRPAAENAPQRRKSTIEPSLLDSVDDDSPFRYEERTAWFRLLELLQKANEADMQEASAGGVTFLQLFRQSEEYRGELVTVRGIVRRAHRLSVPANDCGLKNYYQTWITPEDDLSNLVVVYCLELPEGFPTGMTLSEDVHVTGFFFKRWLYNARDTLRTAPVLLARTVQWRPAPVALAQPRDSAGSLLWMVAFAALVALLVTLYVHKRTGSITAKEMVSFKGQNRPEQIEPPDGTDRGELRAESQGPRAEG